MDSERIDELLNKYWSCETSLEEEQQLQDYFQSQAVAPQHNEAAALFKYFALQKGRTLNDTSLENTVMKKVHPPQGRMRTMLFNTMRIAAGIAVLVMAVWFVRMEIRKSVEYNTTDTYDDPKLAFEETKKALLMISKSFGTAEEQARKIDLFNEAREQVQKGEVK